MVTQNHFVIPAPILEKFMFPQEECQTGPASTVRPKLLLSIINCF